MHRTLRHIIYCALALCTGAIGCFAQEDNTRFTAALSGGLYINNKQAWQLKPSLTWHFHKYIGLRAGIEFSAQYNQPGRSTMIDGHEAELCDNERNVAWIMFKPSIVFKSPDIWKSADNDYRLWLQIEPGVSLACPFRNSLTYEIKEFQGAVAHTADYRRFTNEGLQWFYWNARASVNFAIDRFIVGAGYYISNLDYYSGRRNVTLADGQKFYAPAKEISHSVFISLGYNF